MRKFAVNLILLLILAGSVAGAVPNIVNFSSTGGVTTNKNGDQDLMYLINPGDALVFTATVDQAVSYEWAINKSTATHNKSYI